MREICTSILRSKASSASPFSRSITFFTSGPDTITFPVKVYSMVRFSVTPEVNAASTLLIILTVVLTFIALKAQGVKAIAETH